MTRSVHGHTRCLLFVVLSAALLAVPSAVPARPHPTGGPHPIRVGSDHDYPPYEFNDSRGNPTGFNIELIRAVMDVTGLRGDIRLGVWSTVRESLLRGEIDVIAGMYHSKEREKSFGFSVPHNQVSSALFVRDDNPLTRFSQIRGRAIVVQRGDIMHDYLIEQNLTGSITVVDDPIQALTLVASGRHDGVLISSKIQGLYFIETHSIKGLRVIDTELPPRDYCFAVGKDNPGLLHTLNEGLAVLKHTGRYREIYDKWFGVYEARSRFEAVRTLIVILVGIVALLALISTFTLILRLQVRRQTRELATREKRFRHLVESAGDIIYVIDDTGIIHFINPVVEIILGYPPDDLVGRPLFDLIHAEHRGKITALYRHQKTHRLSNTYLEFPLIRKDGKTVWVGQNARLLDNDDPAIRFQAVARDITERRRMDQEREQFEKRLQRAEKMEALGTLAGGVAHDLNNVLGILVGYSELMLNDLSPNEPLYDHVEKILSGGMRAAAIVQDLLTLARRGVQSETVLNLNTLIRDFLDTPEYDHLRALYPGVRLTTDLAPDLLHIKGSHPHLFKCLLNLLTNAAESMPDGGDLTIRTMNRHLDTPVQGYDSLCEGDYIVLSVADTGGGIAENDLAHIFEPFYTRKVMGRSGTGLGLAVVWGTVKDHRGYIDVSSKPGRGTVFTLYFPVTREQPELPSSASGLEDLMGRSESILVVDDSPEQQELAARMLKKLNYRVDTASGGEAAVDILKTRSVDLVVLDMIMDPGMDGLDTYKQIRTITPDQKVIIVSGYSPSHRVRQAQALGAGAYVKKPYILETLGKAVREELKRRRPDSDGGRE
ncbi:hypothetical protein JCM14469_20170 [Desulfatiferula olefinivorans]